MSGSYKACHASEMAACMQEATCFDTQDGPGLRPKLQGCSTCYRSHSALPSHVQVTLGTLQAIVHCRRGEAGEGSLLARAFGVHIAHL